MTLNYTHAFTIFAGLLGLMSFWRGAWATSTTLGIVIAMLVVRLGQPLLTLWANRFYVLAIFALKGGLTVTDPSSLFQKVRQLPPRIATSSEEALFSLAVFAFILLCISSIGRLLFPLPRPTPPLSLSSRLQGAALGIINGYLIAYFAIPRIFLASPVIVLPSRLIVAFLHQHLASVGMTTTILVLIIGARAVQIQRRALSLSSIQTLVRSHFETTLYSIPLATTVISSVFLHIFFVPTMLKLILTKCLADTGALTEFTIVVTLAGFTFDRVGEFLAHPLNSMKTTQIKRLKGILHTLCYLYIFLFCTLLAISAIPLPLAVTHYCITFWLGYNILLVSLSTWGNALIFMTK